jgi:hypothetical protein
MWLREFAACHAILKSVGYRTAGRAHCSTATHRIISRNLARTQMLQAFCSRRTHQLHGAAARCMHAPACASTSGLALPSRWLYTTHVAFAATHSMLRSEGQLDDKACLPRAWPMLYMSSCTGYREARQHTHERNALRCTWSACQQQARRATGVR